MILESKQINIIKITRYSASISFLFLNPYDTSPRVSRTFILNEVLNSAAGYRFADSRVYECSGAKSFAKIRRALLSNSKFRTLSGGPLPGISRYRRRISGVHAQSSTSVTNSGKNSIELCQCFLRRLRECRLSCGTMASGSFTDCPSSVCSGLADVSSFASFRA